MVRSQFIHIMGRKVDDQQAATRTEDPRCLGQRPGRVFEEVQNLMNGDEITEAIGKRQGIDLAVAHLSAADAGCFQVGPGDGQHVAA